MKIEKILDVGLTEFKVVKNTLKYAVIKIHWDSDATYKIDHLHHNKDNIFVDKEDAKTTCRILNNKNLEDNSFNDSYIVVEIPLRKLI